MTPFDYKDANVFRFSLFSVSVRFKLCSVEPHLKKRKGKKEKAEKGTEAGELCDTTFHLSPYIITECEFLCSVKIEGQFV